MRRTRKVPENYLTKVLNQNIRIKRALLQIVVTEIDQRPRIETMQAIKKIPLVVVLRIQQNQRDRSQGIRMIKIALTI